MINTRFLHDIFLWGKMYQIYLIDFRKYSIIWWMFYISYLLFALFLVIKKSKTEWMEWEENDEMVKIQQGWNDTYTYINFNFYWMRFPTDRIFILWIVSGQISFQVTITKLKHVFHFWTFGIFYMQYSLIINVPLCIFDKTKNDLDILS